MISLHVIDVTRAVPASGMAFDLFTLERQRIFLLSAALDERGGCVLDDDVHKLAIGMYDVVFSVGDYYRQAGFSLPEPAFLEDVPFRFGVSDSSADYHLPMKMSPWGFSLFRGG